MSHEVHRAREECCDDLAVAVCGDAKLYARALTNLECLRQPTLALATANKPLLARVKRPLGQGTPPSRLMPVAASALLTISILLLLGFY